MQLLDGSPVYSATDLVGFLACGHRFELERAALAGLVKKPIRSDPTIELIQERGYEHERRYLADLRAAGPDASSRSPATARRRTRARACGRRPPRREAAMRAGADVVYQATFFDEAWRGHADFLLRVDHAAGEPPSALGAWHYEVADTKLARHVKAGAVLQICSYVDQLERLQGRRPELLHVALGGSARETVSLRVDDYMAYYRRVKADFLAAADPGAVGPAGLPAGRHLPGARRALRRLPLVGRLPRPAPGRRRPEPRRRHQRPPAARPQGRRARRTAGRIATRRGLAALELAGLPKLDWSSRPALERVREQARIQVEGEDRGEVLWELLEPEWATRRGDRRANPRARPGLPRPAGAVAARPLPRPRGRPVRLRRRRSTTCSASSTRADPPRTDPRWAATRRRPGRRADAAPVPRFVAFWSRDAEGLVTLAAEKAAFERLVDFLIDRLDADPTLHVYHYAAYEKTALGAARPAPRDARGGGRPAAPGPRPRGPLPRRPAGDPGQRRELLDQAPRAPLRPHPRGRPQGRGEQHRRVRDLARPRRHRRGARRRRDPARDRGLQPRRRREHVAPARLAGGPAARPRGAAGDGDPPAARRSAEADGAGRARGARGRGRRGGGRADARPRGGRPRRADDDRRAAGDLAPGPAAGLAPSREQGVLVALLRALRHDRRRPRRRARADRDGRARRRPRPGEHERRPPPALPLPAPGPRREGGPRRSTTRGPARRPSAPSPRWTTWPARHDLPDRRRSWSAGRRRRSSRTTSCGRRSSRTRCCGSAGWVAEQGIAGGRRPTGAGLAHACRAGAPPSTAARGSPGARPAPRSVAADETLARGRRPPRPRPRRRHARRSRDRPAPARPTPGRG